MKKLLKLIFLSMIISTPLVAIESHIVLKVNNEIVTNIDIDIEYKYLIALNNELIDMNKETLFDLAKESILREKIKKIEILKYYEMGTEDGYLENIIKNFYEKLSIKNLNDFEEYLDQFDLKLANIRNKIEIEVLWNRLIGQKYANQINIDEERLRKKIEKNSNNSGLITEYELSEIIIQLDNENDLIKKINLIEKNIKEQGFKNTANIYSIAASSKFGGSLGWVDEKQLSQEINLAIKKLEIGKTSKPIKIPNGYLILKIDNKKKKNIEIDKKKLLEQAISYETNKQYKQFSIIYFNKIRLNSIINEK